MKNLKRKPILLRGHGTELLRKSSVSNCSSSYKSVLTILSRIKHSRTQGLHALLGLSKCNFSSEIHQSRPFFFDKTNGKTSILYIIWRERTTHIFFVFPKKNTSLRSVSEVMAGPQIILQVTGPMWFLWHHMVALCGKAWRLNGLNARLAIWPGWPGQFWGQGKL